MNREVLGYRGNPVDGGRVEIWGIIKEENKLFHLIALTLQLIITLYMWNGENNED